MSYTTGGDGCTGRERRAVRVTIVDIQCMPFQCTENTVYMDHLHSIIVL